MDMTLAAVLPAAVFLDALFGEPPAAVHPVCLMGKLAQYTEKHARNFAFRRGNGNGVMFTAGMIAALLTALPFAGVAGLLVVLGASVCATTAQGWLGLDWYLAVLCVAACLAPRSLGEHAVRVAAPLEDGDSASARQAVSMLVGRNTEKLDNHGIARACVESVSENLTDGVLSTLFWAALGGTVGGLPGVAAAAVLHRVSNVLDALWGKRNEAYKNFGTWAARVDDVLNFFPARLSLPIIALSSAFVCSRKGEKIETALRTLRTGWRYRYAHASPNSAWSEAAFAGALHLQLGGPVYYKDLYAPYPFIGDGRPEATPLDIRKSVRLMWFSTWLFTLCGAVILISIGGRGTPLF